MAPIISLMWVMLARLATYRASITSLSLVYIYIVKMGKSAFCLCYNEYMIQFSGDRKQFGEYYAVRLKANHHNFYDYTNAKTLRKQLNLYQKYYPELITERIAAAHALQQNPDFLLYEDLASFVDVQRRRINPHQHGCTIFAVRENGKVFVGRNYDWLPEARNFFEHYDFNITGANRYFAFSDESVWGRHTGRRNRKIYAEDTINEYGLYVGLTYSHIDKWNYGLAPTHFLRYIAEHCSTTRQALNVFARIPCAIPKNFLIADAKGDLAVVEHTSRDYVIIRPDANGVLIQTNHCLAPKLQPLDRVLQHSAATTSFVRAAEAKLLVQRQLPNFQFTDLWRILRASHYIYNNDTIWSLALELTSQRFNLYYDASTGQKHVKFGF